jgi:hypothetical protein
MNVGAEDATSPRGSAFDFISKSDPDVEIETSIISEENAEESAFSFLNKAKDTDESSSDNVIIIVLRRVFKLSLLII